MDKYVISYSALLPCDGKADDDRWKELSMLGAPEDAGLSIRELHPDMKSYRINSICSRRYIRKLFHFTRSQQESRPYIIRWGAHSKLILPLASADNIYSIFHKSACCGLAPANDTIHAQPHIPANPWVFLSIPD